MSFVTRILTTGKTTLGVLWRHKWKTLIATLVIVPIALAVVKLASPKPPEYVTAKAERGNLTQMVEAVGTVTSDRDLKLQFKSSGIVSQILVTEGQKVKAGQRLAALKAGTLGAGVASAAASVKEAEALLQALKEGSRPEDIAISEANVANKRASLQTAQTSLAAAEANLASLRLEANVNLSGQVQTAANLMGEKITRAEQALQKIDDVFANTDVQDAIVKSTPSGYQDLQKQVSVLKQALGALHTQALPTDYQEALDTLTRIRSTLSQTASLLGLAYSTVSNLSVTNYLSSSDREDYKATLADERNALIDAVSELDDSVSDLRSASANYDTQISTQQGLADKAKADVQTYQTSLAIDEANLALKKAGSRPTDIAAADARLRAARANLARASAEYGDTVLTAPVDGVITDIDIKLGELTPAGAAIQLLGSAPLRVEMFVSEVDVPKVKLSQSGSIELDAFPDQIIPLRVSQIADAPTDVSGVSKYKVTLDFLAIPADVKVGMTGDADIVTGSATDVMMVPLRSVLQDSEGQKLVRILKGKKVTDRFVDTGIEGEGGLVEVTNVEEGEEVIVLVKQ